MERDEARDRDHIHLLGIFHWVAAVGAVLIALIPVIHLLIGIGILHDSFPDHDHGQAPHIVGWFFVVFALVFILGGLAFAFCLALSAMFLSQTRHRTFSLVMAGLSCVFFPFGTALGVFTIIVLTKDSVRALYDRIPAPPAGA